MIGAFPNGGQNAGRSYIGAIAAALCSYPRSIAIRCADPLRGVARATRFLPTVADVVGWCDPEVEQMYLRVRNADQIDAQLRDRSDDYVPLPPPQRHNVLIRPNRPRYAEMIERSRTADPREFMYCDEGIWVPEAWWHEARQ